MEGQHRNPRVPKNGGAVAESVRKRRNPVVEEKGENLVGDSLLGSAGGLGDTDSFPKLRRLREEVTRSCANKTEMESERQKESIVCGALEQSFNWDMSEDPAGMSDSAQQTVHTRVSSPTDGICLAPQKQTRVTTEQSDEPTPGHMEVTSPSSRKLSHRGSYREENAYFPHPRMNLLKHVNLRSSMARIRNRIRRLNDPRFSGILDNNVYEVSRMIYELVGEFPYKLHTKKKKISKKLAQVNIKRLLHKICYLIVMYDLIVTSFWIGRQPESYYIWHTIKYVLMMLMRFYDYTLDSKHYYMLDFCYFANILILLLIWVFDHSSFLFHAVFGFTGILSLSVVFFRDSIVPHCIERATSASNHLSPILILWVLQWAVARGPTGGIGLSGHFPSLSPSLLRPLSASLSPLLPSNGAVLLAPLPTFQTMDFEKNLVQIDNFLDEHSFLKHAPVCSNVQETTSNAQNDQDDPIIQKKIDEKIHSTLQAYMGTHNLSNYICTPFVSPNHTLSEQTENSGKLCRDPKSIGEKTENTGVYNSQKLYANNSEEIYANNSVDEKSERMSEDVDEISPQEISEIKIEYTHEFPSQMLKNPHKIDGNCGLTNVDTLILDDSVRPVIFCKKQRKFGDISHNAKNDAGERLETSIINVGENREAFGGDACRPLTLICQQKREPSEKGENEAGRSAAWGEMSINDRRSSGEDVGKMDFMDKSGLSWQRYRDYWRNYFFSSFFCYMLWSICYSLKMFLFSAKKIQEKKYATLYKYVALELGMLYKFPEKCWQHGELTFMICHLIFFFVGFLFVPIFYHSYLIHTGVLGCLLAKQIYNGASFYIDYFSKHYENQLALWEALQKTA